MENIDRKTIKAEKRKLKRFKTKNLSFALLKSSFYEELGEIVDISKGGLAFQCLVGEDRIKEPVELDIILAGNGFHIKKIPCKTISDFEMTNKIYFSSLKMRRHSIKFGELDNNQISELDYFIKQHTIGGAQTN
ncbi:MAG: PilZ domain-containing protein [Desulfobacteraceae bacterium]|nr:PilZ domain-containing protein [Pseudomonadota bacterium]MBU4414188.1 PilZ domain-containing protein [Pseudomonadota bacterium]MCG2759094.1 PilZ domain-containing protein [Desulfobacteraceae bacterium]